MEAVVVVIILQCFKLSLQIDRVPEQRMIVKLTTNGSDQALDKDEAPSNDMFVDLNAKRLGYDQGDPRAAEVPSAALEFNDDTNQCIEGPLDPDFFLLRREEPAVLAVCQALMEILQD